ncbi:MAG TPA: autoinducer binding domain-containing protein, partial [Sphingomonas sp.]|nr:autoinducer binding domain-containing protein [Sphingomonas sp.]
MGFRYFALVHHVDTLEGQGRALRIHNYPESFSAWFDANRFARLDPVHRACHQTSMGFSWSTVAGMIRLGQTDLAIFQRARDEGIGNGFTVPAHVPGESRGSCSFAVAGDAEVPHEWFPVAQLIGVAAFEAARCLNRSRRTAIEIPLRLTER